MINSRLYILHITPHLGGGVGSVLLNWIGNDTFFKHEVITLDYANEYATQKLLDFCIPLYSQPPIELLDEKIKQADIVLIHFWNHPLLYDLIVRHKMPSARVVFWAHISGLSAPNVITGKVANYPDEFVLTTPISKRLECVKNAPVIMSTSGIQRMLELKREQHSGFTVGYIGTVDYAKMHPHYITVSKKIDADHFLIVGGNDEKNISLNADSRFSFTGKVIDIRPYLAKMDVFGYMLNENHFGTCEQVLQEAMAAGVPAVVMDNPCERSIIQDGVTGLIAKNEKDYIRCVMQLKTDRELYDIISKNAQKYARQYFSLETMMKSWKTVFTKMMHSEKKNHFWNMDKIIQTSFDVFCESIGDDAAKIFTYGSHQEIISVLNREQWKSSSKGTPKQYFRFLGGNELSALCQLYSD